MVIASARRVYAILMNLVDKPEFVWYDAPRILKGKEEVPMLNIISNINVISVFSGRLAPRGCTR